MSMRVSMVPPQMLNEIWFSVEPMIRKATDVTNGRETSIDVFADCVAGRQTLWVAFDKEAVIHGCCTVKIINYPTLKSCSIEMIAGEGVDEWLGDGFHVISEYAMELGCRKMEGQGRPGWEPMIKKLGWERYAVRYEFDLPKKEDLDVDLHEREVVRPAPDTGERDEVRMDRRG